MLGCSAGGDRPAALPTTAGASASPTETQPPFALAVTPADKATGLPISAEISTAVTSGFVTSVTVADAAGKKVGGALRTDGSSWVPCKPLKFGTRYTATVVASGRNGETDTRTVTFTTMRAAGKRAGTRLYLFDDHTYGVAMPIGVEILTAVPEAARASVQRRFFVETDPPQPARGTGSTASRCSTAPPVTGCRAPQ